MEVMESNMEPDLSNRKDIEKVKRDKIIDFDIEDIPLKGQLRVWKVQMATSRESQNSAFSS